jgi:glycosyltransferase involved in cell wall biosynthesis
MKIGLAGYVSTESIAPLLSGDVSTLPKGFPGAPFFGTLVTALLERGHDVSVYTLSDDIPPSQREPIVVRNRRFSIYYCPYRRHSFRPNGLYLGRSLDFFRLERRMLRRAMLIDRPDIVHAHWTYELALAAMASGLPYVVTCHDSPLRVLLFFKNAYRLGRYVMARAVLRRATHLTAVSPYLRDEVKSMASVPIEVVPNPLPASLLDMAPERPREVDPIAPRIAMVLNGWIDLKNPKGGFAAFGMLRQGIPRAELHVFGTDYDPHGPAAQWAERRGLTAGVRFHGAVPHQDLLVALRSMHLLLHPSLEEAGSMIVTEAMALGLPIVGGIHSGAMPWITGNGAAGVMTDVTRPALLCAAMRELLDEPEYYAGCATQAVLRARSVFSAESVAKQYEIVYGKALHGRVPASAAPRGSAAQLPVQPE